MSCPSCSLLIRTKATCSDRASFPSSTFCQPSSNKSTLQRLRSNMWLLGSTKRYSKIKNTLRTLRGSTTSWTSTLKTPDVIIRHRNTNGTLNLNVIVVPRTMNWSQHHKAKTRCSKLHLARTSMICRATKKSKTTSSTTTRCTERNYWHRTIRATNKEYQGWMLFYNHSRLVIAVDQSHSHQHHKYRIKSRQVWSGLSAPCPQCALTSQAQYHLSLTGTLSRPS